MNLLEKLASPEKTTPTRCYTADWLKKLDPETRTGVLTAMGDARWKSTDLHILLTDSLGYERQYTAFRLHRTQHCSCARITR